MRKFFSCLFAFFSVWISVFNYAEAANLTLASDTLSNSAPGASANHAIVFTATNTVPSSGKIIITPQAGVFTMPAGLDFTDIDLLDDGTNLVLAASPGSGAASAVGVSVESGTSGSIAFTLNDTDAIGAGSAVVIKIGTNAVSGETGNQQIQNPSAADSYRISVKTYDSSDGLIDQADLMVATISSVDVSGTSEEEEEEEVSPPPPPPPPPPAPAPAGGGGGITPFEPVETTYACAGGRAVISPEIGGTIICINADGSSITMVLPAGFWHLTTTFTITAISKNTAVTAVPIGPDLEIVGDRVYSIVAKDREGSEVTRFLRPATAILRYTDAQTAGLDEKALKLYSLDSTGESWEILPEQKINPGANTIAALVERPSLLAIMSPRRPRPICPPVADFNGDCRVDLIDFSILLYNWGAPKNPATDINNDGRVDLVDFSIMLYWWTG